MALEKNCCGMLRSCKISRERKTEIKPSKGPFQWNYAFPLNIFQDLNTLKACWHTCKLTSTEAFQQIPSEKKNSKGGRTNETPPAHRKSMGNDPAIAWKPPTLILSLLFPVSVNCTYSLFLFFCLSLSCRMSLGQEA